MDSNTLPYTESKEDNKHDIDFRLYNCFKDDYKTYRDENRCVNSDKGTWTEFINNKDIGVHCNVDDNGLVYTITDCKKLLIAKLKHGF
jgi:hypothetical protein